MNERLVPSNDNQVLVAVELLNLQNDISRLLLDDLPQDMAARRALALTMREVAEDLEVFS